MSNKDKKQAFENAGYNLRSKDPVMAKVERVGDEPGRLQTWTRNLDLKLKAAEQGQPARSLGQLTELDNHRVVPPDVSFPYRPADADVMNVTLGHPLKRKPLTTIAHNYTFWADLIFQPESRERGMLLIVEGTSRWCWCWPFFNKSAEHIADIIRKFIEFIDERITCLVTDGGKEWQNIPPLTEEYGFVWKRKNVALTGHGAMARLDRTVRTLRYYMEMLWLASEARENNWYKLFQMAVWVHNNSTHRFSEIPPQTLITLPGQMGKMRKWQYLKNVWNYGYFQPYI